MVVSFSDEELHRVAQDPVKLASLIAERFRNAHQSFIAHLTESRYATERCGELVHFGPLQVKRMELRPLPDEPGKSEIKQITPAAPTEVDAAVENLRVSGDYDG